MPWLPPESPCPFCESVPTPSSVPESALESSAFVEASVLVEVSVRVRSPCFAWVLVAAPPRCDSDSDSVPVASCSTPSSEAEPTVSSDWWWILTTPTVLQKPLRSAAPPIVEPADRASSLSRAYATDDTERPPATYAVQSPCTFAGSVVLDVTAGWVDGAVDGVDVVSVLLVLLVLSVGSGVAAAVVVGAAVGVASSLGSDVSVGAGAPTIRCACSCSGAGSVPVMATAAVPPTPTTLRVTTPTAILLLMRSVRTDMRSPLKALDEHVCAVPARTRETDGGPRQVTRIPGITLGVGVRGDHDRTGGAALPAHCASPQRGRATVVAVTPSIEQALKTDRVIDITTTGRKTGAARRIEIWFHRVDDRYYITGTPGARSWYANLVATPDFTFHLKGSTKADLAAVATPVEGPEKERVLQAIKASLPSSDLALEPETSPLVEVTWADAA